MLRYKRRQILKAAVLNLFRQKKPTAYNSCQYTLQHKKINFYLQEKRYKKTA